MRIDQILEERRPVFSFEFFPPKTDEGMEQLKQTLQELKQDEPAYVSVTYGAAGATRNRTVEITKWIKQDLGVEAMAHLSCVGEPVERLRDILDQMRDAGIENVLALRGDAPRGAAEWTPHPGGLSYSTELAKLINDNYDFSIGAACFPEVHPEAPDMAHDLKFLKEKVNAGVGFLITQLFYDNQLYFDFVPAARAAGIEVPIIPGIMPMTSFKQIARITELCEATIPVPLREAMEALGGDERAEFELGVAYASQQSADLLRRGAPGIHFYALNRWPATRAILASLQAAKPWEDTAALAPTG
jgi:methylenetetrahydrofolate reductase (NADPH)